MTKKIDKPKKTVRPEPALDPIDAKIAHYGDLLRSARLRHDGDAITEYEGKMDFWLDEKLKARFS